MINRRIIEIQNEIEFILLDLLEGVRLSGKPNTEVLSSFYSLLDELKKVIQGEEYIPRKLTGVLFHIYTMFSAASEHAMYNEMIFIETARLETYLDEIFWESPWK
ncbi:hypothetical protein P8V03_09825 [Clostridium sp. A1-XYC3]|uniref:Uncharacterized protein n=1 Tax=Clostridium tanneri TaxID=3037988 RepID=A0ABU4JTH1_9CLOT|nr:hypothetical protein [Clostridium sp. A1-XYC3]MDW8801452.1 hypothetical protein [Clostridium sp. A1-XYC3]